LRRSSVGASRNRKEEAMRRFRLAGALGASLVLGLIGAQPADAAGTTVTAFVEDQMCISGDIVQVDLSATINPQQPARYRWDFNNDGVFDTQFNRNPDATAFYPDETNQTAVVQAKTRNRETVTDSVTFATLRCEN
jgi:hypothetical protein